MDRPRRQTEKISRGYASTKACSLPVIEDTTGGDNLTGAKLREYVRYYQCNPNAISTRKILNARQEIRQRFRVMMTNLCRPPTQSYTTFDEYKKNPGKFLVENLNDGTRCISTNNMFYTPLYNYFRNYNHAILDDRAGVGWDAIMQTVIDSVFFKTADQTSPPYLRSTNPPKWISFTQAAPFNSEASKQAFQEAIFKKFFDGTSPLLKKMWATELLEFNVGHPIHVPTTVAEYERMLRGYGGPAIAQTLRPNTVMPITINGKTFIVKRMSRFVKQNRSNILLKGVAVGSSIADMTTPLDNEDFTKNEMANDEYEYRELMTSLLVSHYLNTIYGNAELKYGRGLICPEIYAVLIVPSYTIPSGPYQNETVRHEIFVVQEAMDKTFLDWLKEKHRSTKEFLHMIIDTMYLNDAVNMNEMLRPYVERYKKFIRVKNTNAPVFIKLDDCKEDNLMIDRFNNWKLIDLDGCRYDNNPIYSLSVPTYSYISKNPSTCTLMDSSWQFNPDENVQYNLKVLLKLVQSLEKQTNIQAIIQNSRSQYMKKIYGNTLEKVGLRRNMNLSTFIPNSNTTNKNNNDFSSVSSPGSNNSQGGTRKLRKNRRRKANRRRNSVTARRR